MRSVSRRRVWAALAAVLVVSGCSSSSSAPAAAPPPAIDPTVKGMEILGNGTDVFGLYAVEENVKGRVLDVDALNAARLLVYSPDVQEYRYEETAGQTISEYATQRSASLGLSGSYMFFSAELKTTFTNDTYRRDDYSYASIIERHYKHALKVSPGVWASGSTLRPYLSALARKALDDTDAAHGHWSGAEILAAYGTHVMTGIYVGARLDYHLSVQIMDESNRTSLSAFVKAKYGNDFASAEITGDISQETYNAMNAYNRVGPVINAKGGASQYAHPEDDEQYVLWKASLDSNPVFCGLVSGGLLPIWELAPTDARRVEIRAAFEAYAATQGQSFTPLIERITDIVLVNAGQGTSVTLPQGYALVKAANGDTISGHLNASPAGTYVSLYSDLVPADRVYLGYRAEATEQPKGIAGVHVASTDAAWDREFFGGVTHDELFGPGACATTSSPVNLNAGTCGDAHVWSYTAWCTYVPPLWIEAWSARCDAPGTPLYLHWEPEGPAAQPMRCLVVGDPVAVDANVALTTRTAHIWWGPEDVNRDGSVDAADATWVLQHVHWLTNPEGELVNLNSGVQSYLRADWWSCYDGYDDAWIGVKNDPAEGLYVGVCYP